MIGYVLLITAAVAMSLIVYAYIKTFVPKEIPECPDSVSLMIMNVSCESGVEGKKLSLQLKNNGLFSVDGYFIRAANLGQELATIDLSEEGVGFSNFNMPDRILEPNQEEQTSKEFSLPSIVQEPFSIEIIPIRIQIDEENKKRFVTCGEAKIREKEITCKSSPP